MSVRFLAGIPRAQPPETRGHHVIPSGANEVSGHHVIPSGANEVSGHHVIPSGANEVSGVEGSPARRMAAHRPKGDAELRDWSCSCHQPKLATALITRDMMYVQVRLSSVLGYICQ